MAAWLGLLVLVIGPAAAALAQTGTDGPRAEVYEDVNVRAGPGTYYDLIGRLVAGQSEPILGQVTVGAYVWLKINYFGGPNNTGWVLAGLVRVNGDLASVPQAEEPPTPTLPPTATFEFGTEPSAGTPAPPAEQRLPTFTPPVIAVRPTLLPPEGLTPNAGRGGFPPALAIIVLLLVGVFAGAVGLLRGQR